MTEERYRCPGCEIVHEYPGYCVKCWDARVFDDKRYKEAVRAMKEAKPLKEESNA